MKLRKLIETKKENFSKKKIIEMNKKIPGEKLNKTRNWILMTKYLTRTQALQYLNGGYTNVTQIYSNEYNYTIYNSDHKIIKAVITDSP
mgnify:CR=1 FL=1|jgi:hypothetical protein